MGWPTWAPSGILQYASMKAQTFLPRVIFVLWFPDQQKGKVVDKFSRTCLLIVTISVAYIALDNLFWTIGDLAFDEQNDEIYEALEELFERVDDIERVID